jgi:hypothetical protein
MNTSSTGNAHAIDNELSTKWLNWTPFAGPRGIKFKV